ncbi:hypothetical protein AC579_5402 [Pseudocercospora musae]|uniref:Uncharacterized protein n=1 Tax=Pseudocercospora musae TaxID=113226 RepID=A0A139IDS5_9PEZI|nr:hypothetical protein AC579_5402 [Pseudocercospora musae]
MLMHQAYDSDGPGDVWIDRRYPGGILSSNFRQLRTEVAGLRFKKFRILVRILRPPNTLLDVLDPLFRKQLKNSQRKTCDGYSPEPSEKEMHRRSLKSASEKSQVYGMTAPRQSSFFAPCTEDTGSTKAWITTTYDKKRLTK